jgi:hypothetical protein
VPIALKFDQQSENKNMNRTETAVKFIKSDTLPPTVGYSQAVTVRSPLRAIALPEQSFASCVQP